MNLPGEWTGCLGLMTLVGLQGVMVVGVAMALERWSPSPFWQRSGWRAATVTWLLLLFLDVSGLRDQLRPNLRSTDERPVPDRQLASPPSAVGPEGSPRSLTPSFKQRVAERLPHRTPALQTSALVSDFSTTEPFLSGRSLPWPELAWMLGAVAILIPSWLARIALRTRYGRRRTTFDGALLLRVSQTAARVGLRRRVHVFECERLVGPVAFGLLRPSIGLPAGFTQDFTPLQQEAMLAHELAHLAAHDPTWQAAADLMAALLWWHPLAWWTRRRLQAVSEDAADQASLAVAGGPGLLAECLLKLASRMVGKQPLGGLAATGSGFRSSLGKRVEKLVHLTPECWKPLSHARARGILLATPLVLTMVAILCTGWIAPQPQGVDMQNLSQIWKRTLATVALFTTVAAEPAIAAPPAAENPAPSVKTQVAPPGMNPQMAARYGLLPATNSQPAAAPAPAEPAEEPAEETPNMYRMDPQLMRRYGLTPRNAPVTNPRRGGHGKQEVEAKLNQIVLPDVTFDGLPLAEVVKFLQDVSRKHDSAKQGINFLMSNVPDVPVGGTIDPTTGQLVAPSTVDVGGAIIRLHLRDVRLRDVLDAMTRVADPAIKYSVEEYGVLLSPGSGQTTAFLGAPNRSAEPPRLQVRTFLVDTNTFLPGLESAFGIAVPRQDGPAVTGQGTPAVSPDPRPVSPRDVQTALRQLLQQLGVNLDTPSRAVFYNALTGVLMVRGTTEDLELVQAAVETLGGNVFRKAPSANPPQSAASAENTAPTQRF